MTALLIASQKKNYALIELLSEAGADAKILDGNGCSAILLAASNPAENDEILTPQNYPAILKVNFLFIHCKFKFELILIIMFLTVLPECGREILQRNHEELPDPWPHRLPYSQRIPLGQ